MPDETTPSPYLSLGASKRSRRATRRAFTLVEMLLAAFIATITVGIAMSAFITLLKQNRQAEQTELVNQQMRRCLNHIVGFIQSSPAAPVIMDSSGCSIRLAPPDKFYAMVSGTTEIDPITHTSGIDKTNDTITFQSKSPQRTPYWILAGGPCPSAAISSVGSTFTDASTLPDIDVSQLFNVGDTVSVPQTGFDDATTLTVRSTDPTTTPQSVRFTTPVGKNIPNGTMIANSAGLRIRFVVVATPSGSLSRGDFIMYPNDQDLTKYIVIGTNIDPAPRINPADDTITETPFSYDPASRQFVINFQYLPAGNPIAGRITAGTRSFVKVRTNPASL
jgi:type II secretory pathway pseudopilin PulG